MEIQERTTKGQKYFGVASTQYVLRKTKDRIFTKIIRHTAACGCGRWKITQERTKSGGLEENTHEKDKKEERMRTMKDKN